jgi:NAD(P)-dependent dehydrogenase (short-subunit alcohol dehydrogenase family)
MTSFFDMMSIQGRVSLITGGAGHLGRAIAVALAEVGSDIVIVDVESKKAQVLADELANNSALMLSVLE